MSTAHKCETCKNRTHDQVWNSYKCKRLACTIVCPEVHDDCDFYDYDPDVKPVAIKRWVVK